MNVDHVAFEVCVDSAQGMSAAIAGGADRLELCAALSLGGLTPSAGLINLAASRGVDSHVMIRPRAGDFVYTSEDVDLMLKDIETVKKKGLAGVVLGALRSDHTLDSCTLNLLITAASGLQKTLHRAFDLTADPIEALESAIELGFTRVLTSGHATKASDGAELISNLVRQAAGRIQIMAGGGVTLESVGQLLNTGADAIHSSCSAPVLSANDCRLIGIDLRLETDQGRVELFKARIQDIR